MSRSEEMQRSVYLQYPMTGSELMSFLQDKFSNEIDQLEVVGKGQGVKVTYQSRGLKVVFGVGKRGDVQDIRPDATYTNLVLSPEFCEDRFDPAEIETWLGQLQFFLVGNIESLTNTSVPSSVLPILFDKAMPEKIQSDQTGKQFPVSHADIVGPDGELINLLPEVIILSEDKVTVKLDGIKKAEFLSLIFGFPLKLLAHSYWWDSLERESVAVEYCVQMHYSSPAEGWLSVEGHPEFSFKLVNPHNGRDTFDPNNWVNSIDIVPRSGPEESSAWCRDFGYFFALIVAVNHYSPYRHEFLRRLYTVEQKPWATRVNEQSLIYHEILHRLYELHTEYPSSEEEGFAYVLSDHLRLVHEELSRRYHLSFCPVEPLVFGS